MATVSRVFINGLEYYANVQERGKHLEVVDVCILDSENHWQQQVGTQKQLRLQYEGIKQTRIESFQLESVSDCAGTNRVLARFRANSKR